ncbi:MAG: EamA family transporter [Steroidobacter sp.]|nr:EamA family transporter [Steroidobacter sp.]MBL8267502.1 EamA family transporter [Steroidobacter sp.]
MLASLFSQSIGASFAKQLFPVVGAMGMTALRITLAAGLLLIVRRPWRTGVRREHLGAVLRYGGMLGLMNLLIYQAFARIPLGIAVAIEVLGPMAVVLAGTRRALDLIWLLFAAIGLALLIPFDFQASGLDPIGVLFAMGAAVSWALYIVFGKRLSAAAEVDGVSWGMIVATVVTVPFGVADAGAALLAPSVLMMGLIIAALSSALPYSVEMFALRRLPAHVFGILVSASPAVAALAGFAILGERLTSLHWIGICLITVAMGGSTACLNLRRAPVSAAS